jgi:hypothetical protein
MPLTYEPIQSYTLGSAAASITFSSIPATYTDLRLVFVDQETGSVQNNNSRYMRFNADTTSNYSRTKLVGDATSVYSGRQSSQTTLRFSEGGTSASPIFQLHSIDIFSYAGNTFKTVLINSNGNYDGVATPNYLSNHVGLWRSTAAINSILITMFAGTFAIGTTATLYGIKNA